MTSSESESLVTKITEKWQDDSTLVVLSNVFCYCIRNLAALYTSPLSLNILAFYNILCDIFGGPNSVVRKLKLSISLIFLVY